MANSAIVIRREIGLLNLLQRFLPLFFVLIAFMLTRQVPFNSFSIVMNASLFLFFAIQIPSIFFLNSKEKGVFLLYLLCFLALLGLYSLLMGNSISLIIRFFVILSFILLSYHIQPNRSFIDIFLVFITVQSLFLIAFHVYLSIYFNLYTYSFIRFYFKEQGWGDVYSYNGITYNIQLLGNALIPFGLFISLVYLKNIKRILVLAINFLGLFIAGNFAFFLGLAVFFLLMLAIVRKVKKHRLLIFSVLFLIAFVVLINPVTVHVENIITSKSESSNPIRIDQSVVLWEDLNSNAGTLLFGKGLGNTIEKETFWRDYTDNIYFELQSLYFLNQMGLLPFLLYLLANVIYIVVFFKNKTIKIIYFSYLFYSFFNPYFLDTSHIVVIVILISLQEFLQKDKDNVRIPSTSV